MSHAQRLGRLSHAFRTVQRVLSSIFQDHTKSEKRREYELRYTRCCYESPSDYDTVGPKIKPVNQNAQQAPKAYRSSRAQVEELRQSHR